MDTYTDFDAQTDHLCDLVAEACALAAQPVSPGPAGVRLIVHGLQLRAELCSLAAVVGDEAVAADADGVVCELDAWLAHADEVLTTPERLSA